jgi:hypothetical protein
MKFIERLGMWRAAIPQSAQPGATGRPTGIWLQGEARELSIFRSVQIGFEVHPASNQVCTEGSLPEDKAAGAWSWSLTSIY